MMKVDRAAPWRDSRGVSATNADTLYSVAFLDLSEPQVFSHPDIPLDQAASCEV